MFNVAVDIGGTFTDCVIHDVERNRIVMGKAPSDRSDLAGAVLNSVRATAVKLDRSVEEVLGSTKRFVHGSTVATNAMIEREGSPTAYVTTRGHEDTLAIGKIYQKRAGRSARELSHLRVLDMADPPLVERERVFGVTERVDYTGKTLIPLTDDEIANVVAQLKDSGVESVAICLLWSFLMPEHEQRLAEAIREALPDLYITTSVEVAPVLGEYERGVTTSLNAYLGPRISEYLSVLQSRLGEHGLDSPVLIMTAGGGVVPLESAKQRPVYMLDSGPVGGILGSRFVARSKGETNVLCTDVGGTSFDVGLVVDDKLQLDNDPVIAQYQFKLPKVEVKSIGAGGGSIAWVDDIGVLKVGPDSAGAIPGPACYGRGGTKPTVTDANLILGYINADNFLGGTMSLDLDASVKAFEPLAESLGMTVEETAAGVRRIMNSQMADLLRATTVERGHDPRDFTLFAYGGAAASHAVGYSVEAGADNIYIPNDASAFSALGMITADITHSFDRARPVSSPFSADDASQCEAVFDELRSAAEKQIEDEGEDLSSASFERSVLLRFRAQVHEVELDLPEEFSFDEESLGQLVNEFTSRYESIYGEGSAYPDAGVEIVTFRVRVTIPSPVQELPRSEEAASESSAARTGSRPVFFDDQIGFVETTIYDGDKLSMGHEINGPALIERYGDTVVIPPDFQGGIDEFGSIVVKVPERQDEREQLAVTEEGVDPVTYEIIRNRLWAINDEQAQTAARKSGSQFIYEAFDFNSGLMDGEGNGLFAGIYVLFHTTGLGKVVDAVKERFEEIKDGDVFITNDPWLGAVHQNDFVVVSPVFAGDEIVAWGSTVMHQQDVGSPVPGSFAVGARDVFSESPLFTPLRLMDGGDYCNEIEELLLRNTRTPMMNGLNLRAMVASQITTRRRLTEIIDRYGKDVFKAVTKQVQLEVERGVTARLDEIPDGEWFENVYLDHDGNDYELYPVKLRLEKRAGKLIFDFTGTAPQAPGMINGTESTLRGGVMVGVLVTLCYGLPWSTGGLKNIVEIVSTPGTVNNCIHPAACSGGSVCATEATENVAGTALGKMLASSPTLREEAQAVWYPYFNLVILAGLDQYGDPLAHLMFDNAAGGGGARSAKDGVDCGGYFESVSCVSPNVESNEKLFPILELFRRRAAGSYGHGRFRGGTGIEVCSVSHDIDRDLEVIVTTHGAALPGAPGIAGGYPCALNTNVLLRDTDIRQTLEQGRLVTDGSEIASESQETLEAKARSHLSPNDVLLTRNEGGPGFGDPIRRDPAAVARDLAIGLCSLEDAERVYGVSGAATGEEPADTAERRDEIRTRRLKDAIPVRVAIEKYGYEGTLVDEAAVTLT